MNIFMDPWLWAAEKITDGWGWLTGRSCYTLARLFVLIGGAALTWETILAFVHDDFILWKVLDLFALVLWPAVVWAFLRWIDRAESRVTTATLTATNLPAIFGALAWFRVLNTFMDITLSHWTELPMDLLVLAFWLVPFVVATGKGGGKSVFVRAREFLSAVSVGPRPSLGGA